MPHLRHALILGVVVALAAVARAQPPEEEEEAKPKTPAGRGNGGEKPPPPIGLPPDPLREPPPPVVDPPPPRQTETVSGGAFVVRLTELVREADQTKSPELKAFYAPFAVAFDRVEPRQGAAARVTPLPLVWGADTAKFPDPFGAVPFDADNKTGAAVSLAKRRVANVVPFERVAVEAVNDLLAPPRPNRAGPPLEAKLAAAEKLLVAVFFFHDSAREQNRRRGKSWDAVKSELTARLAAVRMARLDRAAEQKRFDELRTLAAKYAGVYQNDAALLEKIYASRLAEAEALAGSERFADLEAARELLGEYESRFPGRDNAQAKRVHAKLAARAREMMTDIKRLTEIDPAKARNLLQSVEKIDPGNDRLRGLQQELKLAAPALIVSAKRMPERMSPTLARFDSERQAVELMYEGLLGRVPDEAAGVRYVPRLAVKPPAVLDGVRELRLLGGVPWADPAAGLVGAGDLAGTLRLMRSKPQYAASDPAIWLADPGLDPGDPNRVLMRFKLGHPHPRGLLTFKIEPAAYLVKAGKALDDADYARRPFGSGPFVLRPPAPPRPGQRTADVVFVANPAYARRPGESGRPLVREIRFADRAASDDLAADFRGDRLHVLPDVPTTQLAQFTADNNLNGRVRVATADDPRRVWALAINHRRPALANPDLRRALTHAIDRERVLNEVYRVQDRPGLHQALTGPFPPKSWASPRPSTGMPSLFNRDLAAAKMRAYLTSPGAVPTMALLYPADDPQAKSAPASTSGWRIRCLTASTSCSPKCWSIPSIPCAPRSRRRCTILPATCRKTQRCWTRLNG